ncbi:response regulator transcription factor [Streptosporangium sandarakinum]|uniref:response regulator transcription factor n=1 Tax=Streptosporangium TaxID=2000 RepID=UPI003383BC30
MERLATALGTATMATARAEAVLADQANQLRAREAEVLKLVGHALSNTEIATRLNVSEATVKTHLNRAMAKLNLGSRAQMVALAYESGLVTPGGGDGR